MYAVPRDDALFFFDQNAMTPTLEDLLQPVAAPIVTMQDRAPNAAAAAMITPSRPKPPRTTDLHEAGA